jgi:Rho-binding antiterminator
MISCAHYDYIEIACLYRYAIRLTLKSGAIIEGIALDTARNVSLEECIKIKTNQTESLVILDQIVTLEALINNPHFQIISFASLT